MIERPLTPGRRERPYVPPAVNVVSKRTVEVTTDGPHPDEGSPTVGFSGSSDKSLGIGTRGVLKFLPRETH